MNATRRERSPLKRRWRMDGPDYEVGSTSLTGVSGLVMWHRLGWMASAWKGGGKEFERFYRVSSSGLSIEQYARRDEQALLRARCAVERWMNKLKTKKARRR